MPHKDPEARRVYLAARKEHNRQVHRAWAAKNLEKRREYARKRRVAKRQRIRSLDYARYHADPEKARARARAKYAKNPGHMRKKARERRAANLEAARTKDRARRKRNGKYIDALARARRVANPEPFRATDRKRATTPKRKAQSQTTKGRRKAQKLQAERNDLTAAQWVEIQETQDHRCYYCRKRCKSKLTQDHLTPLSKGGSHTLHNVIAACCSCNSRKGTRPPPIPVQPLLLTVAPAKKRKAS